MDSRPVLIIGCGAAGISACLHVSKTARPVSLVACHSPGEPSDDVSKIVRADYASLERMREAQIAQRQWTDCSGSFASHYRQCGRIVAYDRDSQTLRSIDENRRVLQLQARERGTKELFERFFGHSDAPDTLTYVHNPDDGMVDWQACMAEHEEMAKKACYDSGGQVFESKVTVLKHDGKRVTRIDLDNGRSVSTECADIVLAVGPWTVELLESSGIGLPPGHRIPVPTGLFAFQLELNSDQDAFFRDKPVFSHIDRAEFLPPTRDGGKAKITWIEPFKISPIRDVSNSALASRAFRNALEWARTTFPRLKGAKVTGRRFYCDGVTATQAPLIARHPTIENLILQCGGSYTRAKDLPTDGAYVARLLSGLDSPERLSWNGSKSTTEEHPDLVGLHEFASMEKQAEMELGHQVQPAVLGPGIVAII